MVFQKFNPGDRFSERKMFEGDWTCSDCGAKITKLPFEPSLDKPTLRCLECHRKFKSQFNR